MAVYVVKPGMWHGALNQYGPGDNVVLSPEEAAGFLDKLTLVEDASAGSATVPTDASTGSATDWNGLDAKVVALLEKASVTPVMVPTMTDDELRSIDGIGAAALTKIRSALGNAG